MEIHDVAGAAGVAAIVVSYGALQLGRMRADGWPYSTANAVGAALILLSLAVDFNLSAAVMETFWLAISLVGLGRVWLRHRRSRRAALDT